MFKLNLVFVVSFAIIFITKADFRRKYDFYDPTFNFLPAELKFMARLFIRPNNETTKARLCSGSLMLKNWVLTAAHCLMNIQPANIMVYFGDNKNMVREKVTRVFPHPDYSTTTYINDIGLIKLFNPIRTDTLVPTGYYQYRYKLQFDPIIALDMNYVDIIALGWNGDKPKDRKIKLIHHRYVKNATLCKPANMVEPYNEEMQANRLCTVTTNSGDIMDKGDSGGPVFYMTFNKTKSYLQVGVLSYQKTYSRFRDDLNKNVILLSSNSYYITTLTLHYFTWIKKTVAQNTKRYELLETYDGLKTYTDEELKNLGRDYENGTVIPSYVKDRTDIRLEDVYLVGIPPNKTLEKWRKDLEQRNARRQMGDDRMDIDMGIERGKDTTAVNDYYKGLNVPKQRRMFGFRPNDRGMMSRRFMGLK